MAENLRDLHDIDWSHLSPDQRESAKAWQRTEALAAYDEGRPSLLPDSNRYKRAVENHRWGGHPDAYRSATCPVCARLAEAGRPVLPS